MFIIQEFILKLKGYVHVYTQKIILTLKVLSQIYRILIIKILIIKLHSFKNKKP